MNNVDTQELLKRLGLFPSYAKENDGTGGHNEVIQKLMNFTLQCLGAIRQLVIEEENGYIEKNCCDLDATQRHNFHFKSRMIVREIFGCSVKRMAESIIYAREIKEDGPEKNLCESFPWKASMYDSSWCISHWAVTLMFNQYKSELLLEEQKKAEEAAEIQAAELAQMESNDVNNPNVANIERDMLSDDDNSETRDRARYQPLTCDEIDRKCRVRQFEELGYMIEMYPSCLNELDRFGQSILAYAISTNSMLFVQLMCDHYPTLSKASDGIGRLPVHYCARYSKSVDILHFLLNQYSTPKFLIENAVDDAGNLPLHEAAMASSSVEVVEELLFLHPDAVRIPNLKGHLPLHLAARNSCLAVVKLIFTANPAAISTPDSSGWLPIHHAAYLSTSVEVVQFLHRCYPSSLTLPHPVSGRIALHYAAVTCPSLAVFKLILGLSPESSHVLDVYRRLPLHYIVARCTWMHPRRIRCLQVCVESFPDSVSFSGTDHRTPYDLARREKMGNYVLFLLLKGNPRLDYDRYTIFDRYMSGEDDCLRELEDLDREQELLAKQKKVEMDAKAANGNNVAPRDSERDELSGEECSSHSSESDENTPDISLKDPDIPLDSHRDWKD